MNITIVDIDIAGIVTPLSEVRAIKSQLDFSLLKFKYTILDINGNILKQDEITLKDKFLNPQSLELNFYSHTYFKYELVMFSRWLKKLVKT